MESLSASQRCLGHGRSPDPPALENLEDSLLGIQDSLFRRPQERHSWSLVPS